VARPVPHRASAATLDDVLLVVANLRALGDLARLEALEALPPRLSADAAQGLRAGRTPPCWSSRM